LIMHQNLSSNVRIMKKIWKLLKVASGNLLKLEIKTTDLWNVMPHNLIPYSFT
jgi:hypothetical protein